MKLWDKNKSTDQLIESFTVGMDRELDLQLAPYDILASIAHVRMLVSVHLLTDEEGKAIVKELQNIYVTTLDGTFIIEGDVLITRAGPKNRVGIVCCVENLTKNLILSDKTIRIKHSKELINSKYIAIALNSPLFILPSTTKF